MLSPAHGTTTTATPSSPHLEDHTEHTNATVVEDENAPRVAARWDHAAMRKEIIHIQQSHELNAREKARLVQAVVSGRLTPSMARNGLSSPSLREQLLSLQRGSSSPGRIAPSPRASPIATIALRTASPTCSCRSGPPHSTVTATTAVIHDHSSSNATPNGVPITTSTSNASFLVVSPRLAASASAPGNLPTIRRTVPQPSPSSQSNATTHTQYDTTTRNVTTARCIDNNSNVNHFVTDTDSTSTPRFDIGHNHTTSTTTTPTVAVAVAADAAAAAAADDNDENDNDKPRQPHPAATSYFPSNNVFQHEPGCPSYSQNNSIISQQIIGQHNMVPSASSASSSPSTPQLPPSSNPPQALLLLQPQTLVSGETIDSGFPVEFVPTEEEMEATYFDRDRGIRGCSHYQRKIKLQAACCGRWFPCRFCHDEVSDHPIVRRDTQNMLCMVCRAVQPAAQHCANPQCGETTARYYCAVCKLWDDSPGKHIYHCDKCGICRIGAGLGVDYFHCDTCNVCMAIALKGNHKCIERNLESDCPICGEYLFTSTLTVIFMPCGHCIHYSCHQEYIKTSFQCPTCFKALADMTEYYRRIDDLMAVEQMPASYSRHVSLIYCNDCETRSEAPYHFIYHKCADCQGYNTKVLDTYVRDTLAVSNTH